MPYNLPIMRKTMVAAILALTLSGCAGAYILREDEALPKEEVQGYVDDMTTGGRVFFLVADDGLTYYLDQDGQELLRRHKDYAVGVLGVKAWTKTPERIWMLRRVELLWSTRPEATR